MFPSCSAEHIAAEQPYTSPFFFFLLNFSSRKLPAMPYLKGKQAFRDATRASVAAWPWHSNHRQGLVWFSSQGRGRCPGRFAQELFPIQSSISLLLPLPGLFGAGREGEICFNPKASPTEEAESELKLYSSPGSGGESQSWRNPAQKRNRPCSSVTSPFDRRHTLPR